MACRRTLCIWCIICLIFVAAPIAIAITLSYVGVQPRFYIQNLHIQNNSINSSNLNTSIIIDLKLKRVIAFAPIRYDDLNITLYHASNRSFPVGDCVVPGFSQGRKKTAHREAVAVVVEDAISGGSMVVLAVELTTKYRLKQCDGDGDCNYSKAKAVAVAADVRLDGSGVAVSKKPIRLR